MCIECIHQNKVKNAVMLKDKMHNMQDTILYFNLL